MKLAGIKAGWGGGGGVRKGEKGKKLGGSKGEGIGERRKGSQPEKHAPNSDWSLK